ncbi:MAG: zinc-binding dehydrogenase [Deltaproteobacteria bacterium]|nr:zinc-binding dehydrogenase [Deltaproteobacteria bacterium]
MLLKSSAVIFKVPPNVSVETAALTEPLAVALQGLDLSGIKVGQTAAVFGPGPIGLLTIQLLKTAGASRIIATGTGADRRRLEIAEQMGADTIIDVEKEDPVKTILKSAGYLDYVFEATGIPRTISEGLKIVKRGGKVMVTGIHATDAVFSPIDLVRNQKSLIGVYNYNQRTWERCLALMASGSIHIDPIVTHRIPFSRGDEGFRLALNKTAAKVIFVPEEE